MEEKVEYTSEELFDELMELNPVREMYYELSSVPASWRDYYAYVSENESKWQEVLDVSAPLLQQFVRIIEFDEETGHYYYDGKAEDELMLLFLEASYREALEEAVSRVKEVNSEA